MQLSHLLVVASVVLGAPVAATPGGRAANDQKKTETNRPQIVVEFSDQMTFGMRIDVEGREKKITFDESGRTNHTFVTLEGKHYVFGVTKANEKFPRQLGRGVWIKEREDLGDGRHGSRCVWKAEDVEVYVTQTVEVVRSQTGRLDTCLVTYRLENKDKIARQVALRAFVDTLINENDGHPFEVPGKKELVTTSADFRAAKEMPEHVKARESAAQDAFFAVLTLKVGGAVEAPDRCSLSGFPAGEADLLGQEIPVTNIRQGEDAPGDACVVMYWNARPLEAGASRTVGYAYGGGLVRAAEKKD